MMKLDSAVFEQVPQSLRSVPSIIKNGSYAYQDPYKGRYEPAPVEAYVVKHDHELRLDSLTHWVPTCHLWRNSTTSPYYEQLHQFIHELDDYYDLVNSFTLPGNSGNNYNLRQHIIEHNNHDICDQLKLHPEGLPGIFSKSRQLSLGASGWMEPLLPPMRHPKFCFKGREYLLAQEYLIHDFQALCHKLKPHSRTVFVDMGASPFFHLETGQNAPSPTLFLLDLFRKFGIQFDHVYAYEMRQYPPQLVFQHLPRHLASSYHWINVPVSDDPNSHQNPFKMIQDNFNQDDLIIVKLDIDTAPLERKLANQLLHSPKLTKLIDHFYFEHHVNQQELQYDWVYVTESVADSMNLFHALREKGVSAHFWV